MLKPNVGHINYLNCLPLTYTFTKNPSDKFNLFKDVPANLNQAITQDKLDISPVSSIIYARNFDKLMILPDISIMADGPVQSIILVSKKPIHEITTDKILLTSQSATSHCLLKIIMNKRYHATPDYSIAKVSPQNPFSDENATASLFIGDDALFLKYHQDKNLYYYDIGQQWKEFTNLCMVYAVWVVRKDFAQENPQKTSIIQQYIKNGFANGFTNLHQAIKEIATDKPFSFRQLDEYLHIIQWKLQEEQLKALSLFYQYAFELNLIDALPQLNIFNPNTKN